jgi:hypothetical protein
LYFFLNFGRWGQIKVAVADTQRRAGIEPASNEGQVTQKKKDMHQNTAGKLPGLF